MTAAAPGRPTRMYWLVRRCPSGKVAAECIGNTELPSLIKEYGPTVIAVVDTMAEAIATRHDAQGRCSRHAGGKGRHVCAGCQSDVLTAALRASVVAEPAKPRSSHLRVVRADEPRR